MIWQGQGANRPEQRGQVMFESSAGATRSRSDADILNAIRSGDPVAYGLLRRRHMPAARRLAQFLLSGSAAAEDAVDQAFENVLAAVQRGGGPTDAFRPYLLSAVREATATMPGQPAGGAAGNGQPGPTQPGGPRPDLVVAAFVSLPERWRAVLWHVCVEGESPAEAGALLGLPEPDAAELASQAREALSLAYHRRMEPGARNNMTDVDGVMRTAVAPAILGHATGAYLTRPLASPPPPGRAGATPAAVSAGAANGAGRGDGAAPANGNGAGRGDGQLRRTATARAGATGSSGERQRRGPAGRTATARAGATGTPANGNGAGRGDGPAPANGNGAGPAKKASKRRTMARRSGRRRAAPEAAGLGAAGAAAAAGSRNRARRRRPRAVRGRSGWIRRPAPNRLDRASRHSRSRRGGRPRVAQRPPRRQRLGPCPRRPPDRLDRRPRSQRPRRPRCAGQRSARPDSAQDQPGRRARHAGGWPASRTGRPARSRRTARNLRRHLRHRGGPCRWSRSALRDCRSRRAGGGFRIRSVRWGRWGRNGRRGRGLFWGGRR